MGDRGNIVVKQYGDHGYVYLYAHWGGYAIPQMLQKALAKRWRWTDDSYLARIIFDVMTEGDHGQETGFGITTYLTDHEYDLLVVDTKTQVVTRVAEPEWSSDKPVPPQFDNPLGAWTFEEFLALDLTDSWDALGAKAEGHTS